MTKITQYKLLQTPLLHYSNKNKPKGLRNDSKNNAEEFPGEFLQFNFRT